MGGNDTILDINKMRANEEQNKKKKPIRITFCLPWQFLNKTALEEMAVVPAAYSGLSEF